ncbi:MAG: ribosome assembly factor SBDS [Thermoplasmata archaeon]|nr:ribosome assembly factor SBDS [Thermoplasmata archaeon]
MGRDQGRQKKVLEDTIIARLERYGEHFEVLIDPILVEVYKDGAMENEKELFATEVIFKDAHKGDRASDESMNKAFETTEFLVVAKYIMDHGDIQLTTEKRKEMLESKTKAIVSEIARNAINPQTKAPHPPQRIELAMKEVGVHVDPFKSVESQVTSVMEAIRPILPIRFEKVKVAVKLPGTEYGRLYGDITKMGKVLKEEWLKDGSWVGMVEIPAGIQIEFYDLLNEKTKGAVETQLVK